MTVISLSKLKPNPFRNVDLYPPDPKQVAQLAASIGRHGAWSGIRARPAGSFFEIAFGHTRVEAARQAGLKSLDIEVVEMSDDEMVRLLTTENATQAGSKAPAVMNEVTAVIQRLAKPMLSEEDFARLRAKCPEIALCFQSQKAYESARGRLEKGDGIGWKVIRSYLGKGDESACPRSKTEINDAIAAVKASGIYPKIVAAAAAQIEAEAAAAAREAEAAEREAERSARAAKTKGDKAKAAKAKTQATMARKRLTETETVRERAKKTASHAEDKFKKVFDERTVTLFDNDEQSRAFRESVTKPSAVKFIPLEQQMPLAKKIMADIKAKPNRDRVGGNYIFAAVSSVLMDAVSGNRKITEEERRKAWRDGHSDTLRSLLSHFTNSARDVNKAATSLWSFLKQHPELIRDMRVSATVVNGEQAVRSINALVEMIEDGQTTPVAALQIEGPGRATDVQSAENRPVILKSDVVEDLAKNAERLGVPVTELTEFLLDLGFAAADRQFKNRLSNKTEWWLVEMHSKYPETFNTGSWEGSCGHLSIDKLYAARDIPVGKYEEWAAAKSPQRRMPPKEEVAA